MYILLYISSLSYIFVNYYDSYGICVITEILVVTVDLRVHSHFGRFCTCMLKKTKILGTAFCS